CLDGQVEAISDRLARGKAISLTFSLEAKRDLREFREVVSQTRVSVQLKVPRAHVAETARRLLAACDVSDINVQQMPIEDVIRQLFGERRTRESAMPAAI